ncbi:DUF2256 domain-containing protein [Patescibacteria group bacterium]|nr:DUF2256 domain-containing protein [Patescibacteria group bacterium]
MVRTRPQEKVCIWCGRPFQNRKRWRSRGVWEAVKYCSARCRHAARRGQ